MFDFLAPLWNLIIYNPMLNALLLIYSFIPNYGVAIVIFTLIIAGLTMPLRIKSQQSMRAQQEKQAVLKPKLDELKKKYKDNPQALQQAQMKLYQEEGLVNPLNSGCLLTLIPFPIFIGLYSVITSVMGSTPETLLQLSSHVYPFFPKAGTLVPVNPDFFGLNLAASPQSQGLLITVVMVGLVVGVQYIQQKMMTMPTATMDPQAAAMNQQMQLIMPIFFGWIVLGTPAGLSLYWITFGLLTVVQQGFTTGWGPLTSLTGLLRGPQPVKKPTKAKLAPPPEKKALPGNGQRVENSSAADDMSEPGDGAAEGEPARPVVTVTPSTGSKKGKKKRGKKY